MKENVRVVVSNEENHYNSIPHPFLVKRLFWPGNEVSGLDIWAPHFYLVVLQDVVVGFAEIFPVSPREGGGG